MRGFRDRYTGPTNSAGVIVLQNQPVSHEAMGLGLARQRYLEGGLDVVAFEREVEHVLAGNVSTLIPMGPPAPRID
jgi:hypothetical protein